VIDGCTNNTGILVVLDEGLGGRRYPQLILFLNNHKAAEAPKQFFSKNRQHANQMIHFVDKFS
jgi:hypothetical protein